MEEIDILSFSGFNRTAVIIVTKIVLVKKKLFYFIYHAGIIFYYPMCFCLRVLSILEKLLFVKV